MDNKNDTKVEEIEPMLLENDEDCEATNADEQIKLLCFANSPSINVSNINGFSLDEKLVKQGANSVSEMVGKVMALVACGITPSEAFTYIANKEITEMSIKHEHDISLINQEATIKSAQYGNINSQKDMI